MNVPSMKKPTALWTSRRRLRGGHRLIDSSPRTGLFQDGPFRDGRSRTGRRGFTLAELLVVIAIIGFLSAIGFGALQQARKSTAIDRTKRTVTKIHYLLMEKLDSYRTRRVDLDLNAYVENVFGINPQDIKAQDIARAKLSAIRDLMRMEMPERWTDIGCHPNGTIVDEDKVALVGSTVPAQLRRYRHAFLDAKERASGDITDVRKNASPELLYMIVMGMPGAAEQFHSTEIGDTDGDGLREFIDAWGNPIRYLRWPAGYIPPDPPGSEDYDVVTDLNAEKLRDPFDSYGVYVEDYAVYPLVYSAGPDGIYDINIGPEEYEYKLVDDSLSPNPKGDLKVCVRHADSPGDLFGTPIDKPVDGEYNHYDNVTNHALDNR